MTHHDQKLTAPVFLASLVTVFVFGILMTLPLAYVLMLFAGNVGLNLSFVGAIPGAILLTAVRAKVDKKE